MHHIRNLKIKRQCGITGIKNIRIKSNLSHNRVKNRFRKVHITVKCIFRIRQIIVYATGRQRYHGRQANQLINTKYIFIAHYPSFLNSV